MTLTTSTTHADLTITASLDTETLRVSLDVDGIDAGSGKWLNGITDTSAQLVRDNDDATEAVYSALDSGLRAQLAAQSPAAQCPTLDSLLASMRCGALSACDADWNDLPSYGGATPRDTTQVWSWDETRLLVGDCSDNLEIVDRVNCTWTR
jgi:hypothetical protein